MKNIALLSLLISTVPLMAMNEANRDDQEIVTQLYYHIDGKKLKECAMEYPPSDAPWNTPDEQLPFEEHVQKRVLQEILAYKLALEKERNHSDQLTFESRLTTTFKFKKDRWIRFMIYAQPWSQNKKRIPFNLRTVQDILQQIPHTIVSLEKDAACSVSSSDETSDMYVKKVYFYVDPQKADALEELKKLPWDSSEDRTILTKKEEIQEKLLDYIAKVIKWRPYNFSSERCECPYWRAFTMSRFSRNNPSFDFDRVRDLLFQRPDVTRVITEEEYKQILQEHRENELQKAAPRKAELLKLLQEGKDE